ncbi:hypothetical protein M6D93_04505 [Jatrophihabitans telluris]|uniref:DUF2236 domain-containing protein n=1 Tax=Jatrophihabitans telluris TaxID=2038343 RepID=A0ABY4R058_9ACTN|nr:hypothetical protein [Jatrophihabitans telluris]UQX89268.1 hypothetical protein M6D93_04505 [Jatrophihabitans telluris]
MDSLTIASPLEWSALGARGLGVIVDPVIFRMGQIFLKGRAAAGALAEQQSAAITDDLASLVTFFDLLVLHEQLPAFNYTSTFDIGLNFDQSLGALLNQDRQVIVPVDVQWQAYSSTKAAAIGQFRRQLANGPFLPAGTAQDILNGIKQIEYEWEPNLEGLQNDLPDPEQVRLAQFMVGVLVFAGYAQQSGVPHVLSPRRSRLVAAAGLGDGRADDQAEAAIYQELARRFRLAGDGWRDQQLPWTPSFLPYLLSRLNPLRDGPDVLLSRALDLRDSPAVARYRRLRAAALSGSGDDSAAARQELTAAADSVAKALDSDRGELEMTRYLAVDLLPKAVGVVAGAMAGGLAAGPPGAIAGGLAGIVGEESLKPIHKRLFGWVLDQLPFHSARKLLTRAVTSDAATAGKLAATMQIVWETGPRSAT